VETLPPDARFVNTTEGVIGPFLELQLGASAVLPQMFPAIADVPQYRAIPAVEPGGDAARGDGDNMGTNGYKAQNSHHSPFEISSSTVRPIAGGKSSNACRVVWADRRALGRQVASDLPFSPSISSATFSISERRYSVAR
jgi:hypothetical protein